MIELIFGGAPYNSATFSSTEKRIDNYEIQANSMSLRPNHMNSIIQHFHPLYVCLNVRIRRILWRDKENINYQVLLEYRSVLQDSSSSHNIATSSATKYVALARKMKKYNVAVLNREGDGSYPQSEEPTPRILDCYDSFLLQVAQYLLLVPCLIAFFRVRERERDITKAQPLVRACNVQLRV